VREQFRSKEKKGFDSLVILVSWRLWRQRNARVFQNASNQFSVMGWWIRFWLIGSSGMLQV
jgi:hypothetical protein